MFWRHLPPSFYEAKDLYGNRDLVQANIAIAAAREAAAKLAHLPEPYRSFYTQRVIGIMKGD
ncbi:uncharacterized protein HaLaN_28426 [Haematococcus lacustris]|uniref:Uncharacterized protein n=1 Tax=Haematococcus lacustris TaxID=44745 RepID=A0A6A0AAF8_HAELA|nr:uncharacterized protein HaLaN_28426 [Haematococcus lacustris]